MNINYDKYLAITLKIVVLATILLFIYVLFQYLLPFFAPFVIAIIIALISEPFVDFLEKRIKVPRAIASFISLLLTIGVLGGIITIGATKIYKELVSLQDNLSNYINSISVQLTNYMQTLEAYYNALPVDVSNAVDQAIKGLAPKLQDLITSIASYLLNTISSIPRMAVFIIVTILATYFIISDRKKILAFFRNQIPDNWTKSLSGIRTDTFTTFVGYIKAVLILMGFTFVEVTVGLAIIRADYALLMGLIVAISEVLPIVGTGVVMVPWITWHLISGNMHMALGLTAIYILGIIIRQIMEPKILGDQIGLHPLVTLVAMYVGLELFGIIGMIIGPLSVLVLKNLNSSGVLRLWKG